MTITKEREAQFAQAHSHGRQDYRMFFIEQPSGELNHEPQPEDIHHRAAMLYPRDVDLQDFYVGGFLGEHRRVTTSKP